MRLFYPRIGVAVTSNGYSRNLLFLFWNQFYYVIIAFLHRGIRMGYILNCTVYKGIFGLSNYIHNKNIIYKTVEKSNKIIFWNSCISISVCSHIAQKLIADYDGTFTVCKFVVQLVISCRHSSKGENVSRREKVIKLCNGVWMFLWENLNLCDD